MKALVAIAFLSLTLYTACALPPPPPMPTRPTTLPATAAVCARLLPEMRTMVETKRNSQPLTSEQIRTWGTWNEHHCHTDPVWQQQLVVRPETPEETLRCTRLLRAMTLLRQAKPQTLATLTPEEKTDAQAWYSSCGHDPWPERLQTALHPPSPNAQGYSRALGIVEPSSPSSITTYTHCHGGHFIGSWCSTTTYGY